MNSLATRGSDQPAPLDHVWQETWEFRAVVPSWGSIATVGFMAHGSVQHRSGQSAPLDAADLARGRLMAKAPELFRLVNDMDALLGALPVDRTNRELVELRDRAAALRREIVTRQAPVFPTAPSELPFKANYIRRR